MVRTKKMENAWAIFDWANSVYALVISAAVFPAYFLSVTDPVLNFYGWKISNSSFYSLIISGALQRIFARSGKAFGFRSCECQRVCFWVFWVCFIVDSEFGYHPPSRLVWI